MGATTADEEFSREFNDLLVSTFHTIERREGELISSYADLGISVSEAHVVEAVGRLAARLGTVSVSLVAEELGVSVPSAAESVKRLVGRGFLSKSKNERDKRQVDVALTAAGRKAYRLHALFHQRMVAAVAGELTAEERAVLARAVGKLKAFFEEAPNVAAEGAPVRQNSTTSPTGPAPAPSDADPDRR